MYLLDTNIIIFYFKGNEKVTDKIKKVGLQNCFISEVTMAELLVGARKSNDYDRHSKILSKFSKEVQIITIENALETYALERARLEKDGNKLENFDLLIGATAISNELILVTNNTKHLQRMDIKNIEDWTI